MNYVKGDLLSVKYGIIAHGCNAQGVMGSGVALAIRNMYPGAYYAYINSGRCGVLGEVIWNRVEPHLYVANLITQDKYGVEPGVRYVDYDALEKAFRIMLYQSNGLPVAIPKIGAGRGGGDWSEIELRIQKAASAASYPLDKITIYEMG